MIAWLKSRGGWIHVPKESSSGHHQKQEAYTESRTSLQPPPTDQEMAIRHLKGAATHFRQAVGLVIRVLRHRLPTTLGHFQRHSNKSLAISSTLPLFFRFWVVFRRQSKYRDSCPKSDAKDAVLSNAKKVDAPGATGNHLLIWSFFPLPNLSLPQGLTFWLLLLCCVACFLVYQSGYKRRVKP